MYPSQSHKVSIALYMQLVRNRIGTVLLCNCSAMLPPRDEGYQSLGCSHPSQRHYQMAAIQYLARGCGEMRCGVLLLPREIRGSSLEERVFAWDPDG